MAKCKVCGKCGGNKRADGGCNICDILEQGEAPDGHRSACWPKESMALGVHPKQIKEATERNRRHGVNVTYTRDGKAILPDRASRAKMLKLDGFTDYQGGYGD